MKRLELFYLVDMRRRRRRPKKKPKKKLTLVLLSTLSDLPSSGNPRHLLFYRLTVLVFMATLGADQIQRRGLRVLMFYTTWSWWLLTGFFLAATLASARRVHRDGCGSERKAKATTKTTTRMNGVGSKGNSSNSSSSSSRSSAVATATAKKTSPPSIPLLDAAAVALLHVALPSSLIVVALTWLLLVPMLLSSPDRARVALARTMFFNFASYCQHGFNALFALGEVFLGQIPLLPYLSGSLLSMYSSVFGVWALSLGRVGIWLYPFLNAHKPWAAVAYSGLFVSNWLFFGVACGAFKLRDKMMASIGGEIGGGSGGGGRRKVKGR